MVKNIEKNKEFYCFIVIFGTQSSMRKIMKRFRNGNLYIILSLLVLITSSCSSSRRLQNKEYEILSQKIGVRLDAHDDIRLYRECAWAALINTEVIRLVEQIVREWSAISMTRYTT